MNGRNSAVRKRREFGYVARRRPAFLTAALLASAVYCPSAQAGERIFDWHTPSTPNSAVPEIVPVPLNDQWSYWNKAASLTAYKTYQKDAGKFVSLMIRNEADAPSINMADIIVNNDSTRRKFYYSDCYMRELNSGSVVWEGWVSSSERDAAFASRPMSEINMLPNTLAWLDDPSNGVQQLDYLFLDLEDSRTVMTNLPAVVSQVRAHSNANIRSARIGNYGFYPGTTDTSRPYPGQFDRTQANQNYTISGVDVAMPNLYPYSYYCKHTDSSQHGSNISPSVRSALFWAPLEKLSVAARDLPAEHELIPWVNDFIDWPNYPVSEDQKPTLDDNRAMMRHVRARGSDGYYSFATAMNHDTYLQSIYVAWHDLDDVFEGSGTTRFLNLETNKTGGIEWSAAQRRDRIAVTVSNLGNSTQAPLWPAKFLPQLPSSAPSIPAGTHANYRFQSPYLDVATMEGYTLSNSVASEGWFGPNADVIAVLAPLNSGNSSTKAVGTRPGAQYYYETAAWYTDRPREFSDSDKVMYSAYLTRSSSVVAFQPVNTASVANNAYPSTAAQGPYLHVHWGNLKIAGVKGSIPRYKSINYTLANDTWYEVRVLVDPTRDIDGTTGGEYGVGAVWIRNLTAADSTFTRVAFVRDDIQSSDRHLEVPLKLTSTNKPSLWNGFGVVAFGGNGQIDNISAGYYVPRQDDTFEHYETGKTMNNQGWFGPNAERWEAKAPTLTSGNNSALAATPVSGSYTEEAWWKTEQSAFAAGDNVVCSARLYGTSGVGFRPVNTTGASTSSKVPNAQTGFSCYAYWSKLRMRANRDTGSIYESDAIVPSNKWYDVQVIVDSNGTGLSRVYLRNVTDGGNWTAVSFKNLTTQETGITEVPLVFTTSNNPTTWDGWEIYGYNESQQIDDLRTELYPGEDISAGPLPLP